jgi:hypothetical protein
LFQIVCRAVVMVQNGFSRHIEFPHGHFALARVCRARFRSGIIALEKKARVWGSILTLRCFLTFWRVFLHNPLKNSWKTSSISHFSLVGQRAPWPY